MKKLTITITITAPEELAWFSKSTEEEIAKEIMDDPGFWLDGAEIEVEKE